MKADAFLARIKAAAAAGRQYPVDYDRDLPADTGYYGAGDDPVARFIMEANLVGGLAVRVTSDAEACAAVIALLQQYQARQALVWQHPLLERLNLAGLLAEQSVATHDFTSLAALPNETRRATTLACDIGITSCTHAVAETGSLVMCSEPGRERLASLITPVHIAVIERSQLVPDLFDLFALLKRDEHGRLPSNVTFITGPSKTGDLELRLVVGVHGPKIWHVIVIDRPADALPVGPS